MDTVVIEKLAVVAVVVMLIVEMAKATGRLHGGAVRAVAVVLATIGSMLIAIAEGIAPGASQIAFGVLSGITSSGIYEWLKPILRIDEQ